MALVVEQKNVPLLISTLFIFLTPLFLRVSGVNYAYEVLDEDNLEKISSFVLLDQEEHVIERREIPPSQVPSISKATTLPKSVVDEKRPVIKDSSSTSTSQNPEDEFSDIDITNSDNNMQTHYDFHYYYNSSLYSEPVKWDEYWVNLDNVAVQDVLSNSYRRAITVTLSFDFPFYGHVVRNITIATGGFLYTGDQVHSWLAATQYIAPLMANFDPSLTNVSHIKYIDNGTSFTVEWQNVQLQDKAHAGNFTFQVSLMKSGDIVFVYKEVPISINIISDNEHPVKVGLSDAYIIDRTIFFLRRKTIYEYHRVDLKKHQISNTTTIYFTALPTCVSLKDCYSCNNNKIGFDCFWCANRCSDGMDRHRQDWLIQGCEQQGESKSCPTTPGASASVDYNSETDVTEDKEVTFRMTHSPLNTSTTVIFDNMDKDALSGFHFEGDVDHVSLGTAGILGTLFVILTLGGFTAWIVYAYKFPHTPSGQLLIKYRPSQWHWNKNEPRYTAASVHM